MLRLSVALDATTLGQRFTVLAISVLYCGCAVPVAWKIVKATEPHTREPECSFAPPRLCEICLRSCRATLVLISDEHQPRIVTP